MPTARLFSLKGEKLVITWSAFYIIARYWPLGQQAMIILAFPGLHLLCADIAVTNKIPFARLHDAWSRYPFWPEVVRRLWTRHGIAPVAPAPLVVSLARAMKYEAAVSPDRVLVLSLKPHETPEIEFLGDYLQSLGRLLGAEILVEQPRKGAHIGLTLRRLDRVLDALGAYGVLFPYICVRRDGTFLGRNLYDCVAKWYSMKRKQKGRCKYA